MAVDVERGQAVAAERDRLAMLPAPPGRRRHGPVAAVRAAPGNVVLDIGFQLAVVRPEHGDELAGFGMDGDALVPVEDAGVRVGRDGRLSGQVSPPSNERRSHATWLPGLGSSYSFQLSYGSASAPSARGKTGPVTAQPTCGRRSTSRNGPRSRRHRRFRQQHPHRQDAGGLRVDERERPDRSDRPTRTRRAAGPVAAR